MKISIDQFHGESPKTADRLLTPHQATLTRNCDLRSGNLRPLAMPARTDATEGGIKPRTIYKFNAQGDNPIWFEFEEEVDILRGPLPNDTEERTYITGKGAPKMTYSSIATVSGEPYPSMTRLLGVPAPESAPTVGVNVSYGDSSATGFAATLTQDEDGGIESITVTNGGSGYTGVVSAVIKDNVPDPIQNLCTVDGNVHSDATTEAACLAVDGTDKVWQQGVILTPDMNGAITSAAIPAGADLTGFIEGGTTLSIVDPHKWGSGAELELVWTDGAITGISVLEGGSGYPSDVSAKIVATAGTGCRLKVLAVDGVVQPIQITSKGSGYISPEVVVTNTAVSDTNTTASSRAYVYTFVTVKGEEGPPSPPSVVFDWYPGQVLNVGITQSTVAETGYEIAKIRIYRYAQGASSGDYFFVGEVLVGDGEFVDNILDADLPGGMLETTDYDPPPDEMIGLTSMTNGMMAGFSGREVCFCEPYLPYAWPVKYRMTVDYDIVGLGSLGNGVVVLTTGQPYLIMGTHPSSMGMDKLDIDQSCSSKRSIVSQGGAVAFASPDGLMLISPNGTNNLTKDLFTREQWQKLNPSSILGVFDEGRYLGFFDGVSGRGSFALDTTNPNATLTHSSVFADAVFRDKITDQIYIVDNDDGDWSGTNDVPAWRSKKFITTKPVNFSAIELLGTGECSVIVWADETEIFNSQINTGEIARLPAGFLARSWVIELYAFTEIEQVTLSTSVTELAHG